MVRWGLIPNLFSANFLGWPTRVEGKKNSFSQVHMLFFVPIKWHHPSSLPPPKIPNCICHVKYQRHWRMPFLTWVALTKIGIKHFLSHCWLLFVYPAPFRTSVNPTSAGPIKFPDAIENYIYDDMICVVTRLENERFFFVLILIRHTGAKILNLSKKSHFKISFLTKFTFSESNFSQNSHFGNLIFYKIHIFKVWFFTKFTFLEPHIW